MPWTLRNKYFQSILFLVQIGLLWKKWISGSFNPILAFPSMHWGVNNSYGLTICQFNLHCYLQSSVWSQTVQDIKHFQIFITCKCLIET